MKRQAKGFQNTHELDPLKTREEARRLLYIAMTRARDELCIYSARASLLMDEHSAGR